MSLSFQQLVLQAERSLSDLLLICVDSVSIVCSLRCSATLQAVNAAAYYAWSRLGPSSSPRLERVVWGLSRLLPPSPPRPARPGRRSIQRILHVGSAYYEFGGHGKWVQSFIANDRRQRNHTLFLTWNFDDGETLFQRLVPMRVPSYFDRSKTGVLQCDNISFMQCAMLLRRVASDFDLVVLTIHMYDSIGCVAFGVGYDGPPVVMLEHKDETFYLGASVVDFRVNGREAGRNHFRGGDGFVPMYARLPIVSPKPAVSRDEARKALGLRPHVVLLLSMGNKGKFSTTFLLDLVAPVLKRHPHVVYRVAGPEKGWNERVAALGLRRQVVVQVRVPQLAVAEALHAAADIYLDPLMTGVLSAFESGLSGAVVLGLCPYAPRFRTLCTEASDYVDPSIGVTEQDTALLSCPTEKDYVQALEALVTNADLRRRRGERTKQLLHNIAYGAKWGERVEHFYGWIEQLPDFVRPRLNEPAWVKRPEFVVGWPEMDAAAAK